jgi:hypothetical protein
LEWCRYWCVGTGKTKDGVGADIDREAAKITYGHELKDQSGK